MSQQEISTSPIGPIAAKHPTERHHHGHSDVDPWQWLDVPLQQQEGETEQNATTRQALRDLIKAENVWADEIFQPTAAAASRLVQQIRSHTEETDVSAPVKIGPHWYYTRIQQGQDYHTHHRLRAEELPQLDATHTAPSEETLLDEVTRAAHHDFYNAQCATPTPSGKHYVWLEDTTGGETYDMKIRDLENGEIIDEAVTGICASIAVSDTQIWYVRVNAAWRPHQIWLHHIGDEADRDQLILEEPDEGFWLGVTLSGDQQWVLAHSESADSAKVWMWPVGNVTRPRPVARNEAGKRYTPTVAGDHLVITHNQISENETLALAPLPSASEWKPVEAGVAVSIDEREVAPTDTWRETYQPQPTERLVGVQAFARFIAVAMRRDGQTAIRIRVRRKPAGTTPAVNLDEIYGEWQDVTWPLAVKVLEINANPQWEADRLRFTVESFALPTVWADWVVGETEAEQRVQIVKRKIVPRLNPDDYQVRREWVTATDGTRIPVSLVARRDQQPDGTNPGWLNGYGAYEFSLEPWFTTSTLCMLERGVVVAVAHVRGGGELGREWYEGGRLENKPNTFTDFVDVSKWLIDSGWVQSGRLVAAGASAGGLLMGAVANLAPELPRVIVARVPFVDALNTILNPEKPLTVGEWEEWGNPLESEKIFRIMRGYSPYENVQPCRYPTIIVSSSLNDVRVSFIEPLKWVQRLRDVTTVGADNPVVCRLQVVAGHSGGSGRMQAWKEWAEYTALALKQIGVEV